MNDLVQRLATEQPIAVDQRLHPTADAFQAALDYGLIHISFLETQGGTELSVLLDRGACDLTEADFSAGRGSVRLAGDLVLDFVPVRFSGCIALEGLRGTGWLKVRGLNDLDVAASTSAPRSAADKNPGANH
jgi:hypothetical protein